MTQHKKADAKSISGLRIYHAVYDLVKGLPEKEFYNLGNDLRRTSAAISHYISEAHKRYGYGIKIESLHLARHEADELRNHLSAYSKKYGDTAKLQEDCVAVAKQSWGLIKYFQQRQAERQASASAHASDELVAARA
jgi:four helix bundle protein